jgi:hypothetical protein
MSMRTDRDEKKATDPSTPPGEFRYGVKDPDAAETEVVAGVSIFGLVLAAVIGVVVGLLAALVPAFGIPWWGGVVIGFFVGATLGGFVFARLGLETVSDEPYGNIPKTRNDSQRYHPR